MVHDPDLLIWMSRRSASTRTRSARARPDQDLGKHQPSCSRPTSCPKSADLRACWSSIADASSVGHAGEPDELVPPGRSSGWRRPARRHRQDRGLPNVEDVESFSPATASGPRQKFFAKPGVDAGRMSTASCAGTTGRSRTRAGKATLEEPSSS